MQSRRWWPGLGRWRARRTALDSTVLDDAVATQAVVLCADYKFLDPGSGPGPPLCCRSQSGPYEHIVRVMYRESPLPSLRGTTLLFQHVLDPTPSPVSHQVPILGRAWLGRPTASGWPQSPPRCRGCAQHVPGRPAPLKVRRRSLTLARNSSSARCPARSRQVTHVPREIRSPSAPTNGGPAGGPRGQSPAAGGALLVSVHVFGQKD